MKNLKAKDTSAPSAEEAMKGEERNMACCFKKEAPSGKQRPWVSLTQATGRGEKRKACSPSPAEKVGILTKKHKSVPVDALLCYGNQSEDTLKGHKRKLRSPSRSDEQAPTTKKHKSLRPSGAGKQEKVKLQKPTRQPQCARSHPKGSKRYFTDMGVRVVSVGEVKQMTATARERLQEGAYGSCCKGRDPRTHQEVVIKTFKRKALHSLTSEAATLHEVRGPGVQRLVAVCVETRQLITEYAGITLDAYLHQSPSLEDKLKVLLQVSQALQSVSKKGFAHNDIKGNNICVSVGTNGPVATIIDFGLARPLGTLKVYAKTSTMEPHPWIAPELLQHSDPCSEASDVYGLAMLMRKMLSVPGSEDLQPMGDIAGLIITGQSYFPDFRPTLAEVILALV